ncbi:hypothetical protein FIBSPDRAFT_496930 [Athelia psychrophila]|uniref:Uncharacterized protein n=1 Tax=Athelia psychrophila TaxID=1759441 RepID=A0A167TSD8_9AGAM|nr:hypothetical protein FIBSPDRAFT_496930 [Fibularhizoctonia sp. CBS 109695]
MQRGKKGCRSTSYQRLFQPECALSRELQVDCGVTVKSVHRHCPLPSAPARPITCHALPRVALQADPALHQLAARQPTNTYHTLSLLSLRQVFGRTEGCFYPLLQESEVVLTGRYGSTIATMLISEDRRGRAQYQCTLQNPGCHMHWSPDSLLWHFASFRLAYYASITARLVGYNQNPSAVQGFELQACFKIIMDNCGS